MPATRRIRHAQRTVLIIIVLILLAMVLFNRVLRAGGGAAAAEPAPAHPHQPTIERRDTPPTRVDLAIAFLRFEQAIDWNSLPTQTSPEQRSSANRLFDRATAEFFRGDTSRVPALLSRATSVLLDEPEPIASRRAALARLGVAPPDGDAGSWPPIITAPRALDLGTITDTTIVLRDARTREAIASIPLAGRHADDPDQPASIAVQLGTIITADAEVDGRSVSVPIAFRRAPDPEIERNHRVRIERIEALASHDPVVSPHAMASLHHRAALLADADWRPELAPLVLDLEALAAQLDADIAAAEHAPMNTDAPINTERRRVGDHLRAAHHRFGPLPMRIFAPPTAGGDEPLPLIIAFHGAGVDEHLWFLGYGDGMLRDLAERHGFILAAPRAYTFLTDATRFDAVLDALHESYAIDPDRIYAIGHSMGGVLCTALAQARHDRLGAIVAIAGARGISTTAPIARARFYAPEADPIVPPASIRRTAQAAIDAGLPVELIDVRAQGHTLIVPAVLAEAVEWLLAQRRAPR